MLQINQLTNIHSQAVDNICKFYLSKEAKCEELFLAPQQGELNLKASNFYVQLQLLIKKVSIEKTNLNQGNKTDSSSSQNNQPGESVKSSSSNQGSKDEANEIWSETDGKQLEAWDSVIRGKNLRVLFKGGAGSGKSFSLKQEVRRRLNKSRNDLENYRCSLAEVEILRITPQVEHQLRGKMNTCYVSK